MENFLREGVDIQGMSGRAMAGGDAHFFEDSTSPNKVRQYLDSIKVAAVHISFRCQIQYLVHFFKT